MRILQLFIYSLSLTRNKGFISMEYLPDGLSREQWNLIKKGDNNTSRNKKLSDKSFKSRSFKSFQEALERGEKGAKNFPIFNANEKLRKGEIKKVDIPYMQRNNGAWDNSDVVNKRSKYYKKWTKTDKEFSRNSNKWLKMSFFRNTTDNDKDMWERAGGKYAKKKS